MWQQDEEDDDQNSVQASEPPREPTLKDYTVPALPWTPKRVAKAIVLFPLRVIQLPFQFILGNLLSYAIVPARANIHEDQFGGNITDITIVRQLNDTLNLNSLLAPADNLTADHTTVNTFDGATLRTYDILKKAKIPADQTIKHILLFNGNGMFSGSEDNLKNAIKMAKDTGCNVTNFDYRGVVHSDDPKNISRFFPATDKLIDDGVAQVFRLLELNPELKLSEIELHGLSLGGGVATGVAARLDAYCKDPSQVPKKLKSRFGKGEEPYLFNVQSFRSISAVVVGKMFGSTGKRRSALGWVGTALRWILLSPLMLIAVALIAITRLDVYAGPLFSNRAKNPATADKSAYVFSRSSKGMRGEQDLEIQVIKSATPEESIKEKMRSAGLDAYIDKTKALINANGQMTDEEKNHFNRFYIRLQNQLAVAMSQHVSDEDGVSLMGIKCARAFQEFQDHLMMQVLAKSQRPQTLADEITALGHELRPRIITRLSDYTPPQDSFIAQDGTELILINSDFVKNSVAVDPQDPTKATAKMKNPLEDDALMTPFAVLDSAVGLQWARKKQKQDYKKAETMPAEPKKVETKGEAKKTVPEVVKPITREEYKTKRARQKLTGFYPSKTVPNPDPNRKPQTTGAPITGSVHAAPYNMLKNREGETLDQYHVDWMKRPDRLKPKI